MVLHLSPLHIATSKDVFQSTEAATGDVLKKKIVLKNFASFTVKHMSSSLFQSRLRCVTLLKKGLQNRCFPVKLAKFSRAILKNIYKRLLLCLKAVNYFRKKNFILDVSMSSKYACALKLLCFLELPSLFATHFQESPITRWN